MSPPTVDHPSVNSGRAGALLVVAALLTLAAFADAPAAQASTPAPTTTLALPVDGASIVSLARLPEAPWRPGHRGIDVGARTGEQVVAPGSGTVVFAGWVVNRPVVTIDHGRGLVTSLEPVDAGVVVGTTARRGEPIGTVAEAPGHCTPSICIHWGVRLDGIYQDPLDYLEGFGPVVLLPTPSPATALAPARGGAAGRYEKAPDLMRLSRSFLTAAE